jgi:hypothetical protein
MKNGAYKRGQNLLEEFVWPIDTGKPPLFFLLHSCFAKYGITKCQAIIPNSKNKKNSITGEVFSVVKRLRTSQNVSV